MNHKRSLLLILITAILAGCGVDPDKPTEYTPVLMTRADFEASIEMISPQTIRQPGDIYLEGNLLLVGDKYHGIHLIDNSDPGDPKDIGYLRAPGNTEFEIDQQKVYLDMGPDLVILGWDGSDFEEISRIRNLFPELPPPDRGLIPHEFSPEGRPSNTVIVAWEK
ncbi:MAG: hypothetical protein LPK46_08395 [Bacteroidota bacterium]|nr:hypothetical protein [Bacteroidota bacterium]MDX5447823.1 hypothetical protein [Bacteroidota bacterium]MDX5506142.1 hypothetical protein [Bacteroidota bacterium]